MICVFLKCAITTSFKEASKSVHLFSEILASAQNSQNIE
jgi:hypothetical protein